MKNIKKLMAIILSVSVIVGLTGCGLIAKTPQGKLRTVVAKVNGDKITLADFNKQLEPQVAQIEAQYGKDFFTQQPDYLSNLKTQLLDQMVQQKLLLQKADELKLTKDQKAIDSEVDKEVSSIVKQVGGQKKFEDTLAKSKLTVADYKDMVKKQVIIQKVYANVTDKITVSDQDVINYYYTNQYKYTVKPDTMNVSHILVPTLQEAEKIQKEIKAGLKFTDAAKKYGTDGTKDKGGSLGDIEYTDQNYDKDFMRAALTLPTGKLSDPVKTQYGYHLILVNSRKEYKLKPLDSVKAEAKSTLLEQKKSDAFQAALNDWTAKAKITKYADRLNQQ